MHKNDQRCADLIETTSNALSDDVVLFMLLAVQKDNLELCIKQAVRWYVLVFNRTRTRAARTHYRFHERKPRSTNAVVMLCIKAFPSIWVRHSTEF
jgi:hypothetical protein